MDITPLVIAGKKLMQLKEQLEFERNTNSNSVDKIILVEELNSFSTIFLKRLEALNLDSKAKSKVEEALKQTISEKEGQELELQILEYHTRAIATPAGIAELEKQLLNIEKK